MERAGVQWVFEPVEWARVVGVQLEVLGVEARLVGVVRKGVEEELPVHEGERLLGEQAMAVGVERPADALEGQHLVLEEARGEELTVPAEAEVEEVLRRVSKERVEEAQLEDVEARLTGEQEVLVGEVQTVVVQQVPLERLEVFRDLEKGLFNKTSR